MCLNDSVEMNAGICVGENLSWDAVIQAIGALKRKAEEDESNLVNVIIIFLG